MSFTVIMYTHLAPTPFLTFCHRHLAAAAIPNGDPEGIAELIPQLLVVSSEPYPTLPGWQNIIAKGERGLHDCYVKSLAGVNAARHDVVFLAEHDVLYPCDYFEFKPPPAPAGFWFNRNVYIQTPDGFFPKRIAQNPKWPGRMFYTLTSNCCARRDTLRRLFTLRLEHLAEGKRVKWDEPGLNFEECPREAELGIMSLWQSPNPVVDIRWGNNLTGDRKSPNGKYLDAIPYWGRHGDLWPKYGLEVKA